MCVKAIKLDDREVKTTRLKILSLIAGDDHYVPVRVDFTEIAKELGVSRQLVSYHVHKLVDDGYLMPTINGYRPTEKVLILDILENLDEDIKDNPGA